MTEIRIAPLCALFALFVYGCGDADMSWPALTANTQPANVECRGARVAPTGGADEMVSAPVVPFGAPPSVTVPGVPVRFHAGGRATPECVPPACISSQADAAGSVSAVLSRGAWVTTEVPAIEGPTREASLMRTLEQHWAAGAEETVNTFSLGTLDAFVSQLGVALDAERGLVAGRVLDCAGSPVQHARVRFFDDAGTELVGLRSVYFDGNAAPALDPSAEATAADGRYAAIDVPAAATRIEAWGSDGDAAPTRLACEAVQVEANTLTILVLGPERSDGPAACQP